MKTERNVSFESGRVGERVKTAVAYVCGTFVFGPVCHKTGHVGYAHVMVFCGVFEQQKIYVVLSASFGTEVFYCEALGIGFEREDVDARREGSVWFPQDNLFHSCRV